MKIFKILFRHGPLIFIRKIFTCANYDEGESLCCLLFDDHATDTKLIIPDSIFNRFMVITKMCYFYIHEIFLALCFRLLVFVLLHVQASQYLVQYINHIGLLVECDY